MYFVLQWSSRFQEIQTFFKCPIYSVLNDLLLCQSQHRVSAGNKNEDKLQNQRAVKTLFTRLQRHLCWSVLVFTPQNKSSEILQSLSPPVKVRGGKLNITQYIQQDAEGFFCFQKAQYGEQDKLHPPL